ncbi:MAG TPA: FAD-binding protein [Allosphingosinicella sp.]|nr:FAD-binding protein [Allosphingosinicella sp.]
MSGLEEQGPVNWSNYHKTIVNRRVDAWRFSDPGAGELAIHLGNRAAAIGRLIGRSAAGGLRPVGSGWSFSEILLGGTTLLEASFPDRAQIAPVASGQRADPGDGRRLYLASAGVRVRELNEVLGTQESIFTSGSYDGQTLGGMLGTGVHGSVPTFGAFQDHVRGIQVVTGPGQAKWVERGPDAVLADGFAAQWSNEIIRDPDLFEALLVNLGGLGVVNALLLEVSDGFTLDVVQRERAITPDDLALLEAGEFQRFAHGIWPDVDESPYYIQLILNPYSPYEGFAGRGGDEALITLFYKRPKRQLPIVQRMATEHDPLALLTLGQEVLVGANRLGFEALALPRLGEAAFKIMKMWFRETPDAGQVPENKLWGEANGALVELLPGVSIEWFNAAYAIDRRSLRETLDVMLRAFNSQQLAPSIVTVRFVKRSTGLLAFTPFEDTVVLGFDGIRYFNLCEGAAERIAGALDHAGIPYGQHWGKQGVITPARFAAQFGDPADPSSPAGRWRAARERLLDVDARGIFASPPLRSWGLA